MNDVYKVTSGIPLKWERTDQYDSVIKIIGKNRKLLNQQFKEAAHSEEAKELNQNVAEPQFLHPHQVKNTIDNLLRQYGIVVGEANWNVLLDFAQKKNIIDYKVLLQVFKQRLFNLESHPHKTEADENLI